MKTPHLATATLAAPMISATGGNAIEIPHLTMFSATGGNAIEIPHLTMSTYGTGPISHPFIKLKNSMGLNQRQRRKNRRRAWAAGDKYAFSK